MSETDWDTVTYLRKKPMKASQLRSQQVINAAQRQGVPIETTKKFNAATNKKTVTTLNTAKLDRETEELHHDRIGLDVGRLIQQGRQAKNMTQKELATVSRHCGYVQHVAHRMKLRGKEKGMPLGVEKKK
ncbi:hypothetical protein HPB51_029724 [Rhipicephalus microplus]|uniref:Multiprotein bridging factor 1 N-terminal domain-containing protein n=1 Tax=Rhipicephalus microplus TaxID=6941 RepID=A0A9J6CSS6_RHIMP|nr:hypothetical protein HPB51_029724 [Rhipicephalus microplus]